MNDLGLGRNGLGMTKPHPIPTLQSAPLSEPKLRICSAGDLIAAVPYLLGFRPDESIVFVVVDDDKVGVVARCDLQACSSADYVQYVADTLSRKFADPRYFLVAFSAHRQQAEDALGRAEIALGPHLVEDSLYADGKRFWSRGCTSPQCCPPQGIVYPPPGNRIAAEAVGAGLSVLDGRDEVVAQVSAPCGLALQRAQTMTRQVRAQIAEFGKAEARGELDRLLAKPNHDQVELVTLGLLVQQVGLRDRAWLSMSRDRASDHLRLWQQVTRAMPPDDGLAALCLTGMAAWLAGNGALHVACIEAGAAINPNYSMLQLLQALNRCAASPDLWDRMPAQAP